MHRQILIAVFLIFNCAAGSALARNGACTKKVSKEQIKISFEYSNASNFLKKDGQTSRCNSDERESLLKLIREVELRSPELLKAACLDQTLIFLKIKAVVGGDAKDEAWALPGVIAVTDAFFVDPQRLGALIHELVHCADYGQQVSRSAD